MRMPIPGISINKQYGNSQHNAIKKEIPTKKTPLSSVCRVRIVKPKQLSTATNKEKTTVKKSLLTGWEEIIENQENPETNITKTRSITYNKFGHFQSIDYGNYKEVYDYEYAIDNKWTKKTISNVTIFGADVQTEEVRTLDDQGRVLTINIYGLDFSSESAALSGAMILYEEKEYEYIHDPQGVLVKHISYDKYNPSVIRIQLFRKWCDPLQAYVECRNSNYTSVTSLELNIEDTKYTIKEYSYNLDTEKYEDLIALEEHYFTEDGRDQGSYMAYYDKGNITSENGEKYLYSDNTPQAGVTTKITQERKDGEWVNTKKEEYTNNISDPLIPHSGNRLMKEYSFDANTQDWKLVYSLCQEWTSQGFLHEETYSYSYGQGDSWESYKMYNSNGEYLGYVLFLDNGGYVLVSYDEEDYSADLYKWTVLYTYYDVNGNIIKKLKEVENNELNSTSLGRSTIYELKNDIWVIANGVITLNYGDGYSENEFDFQGRLICCNNYNNNKQLFQRTLYTYTADGLIEDIYRLSENNTLFKYMTNGISLDADSTFTKFDITYDIDGKPRYGYKTETYVDGKIIDYHYDLESEQFVYDRTSVNSLYIEAPDGTRTYIYRELDDNNNVIEVRKEIYRQTDAYNHLDEIYIKEDGKWVGVSKRESYTVERPNFECKYSRPTDCNDEYFFPNDDENSSTWVPTYSASYKWENDAWVMKSGNIKEYTVKGDTLITAMTDQYEYSNSFSRRYVYSIEIRDEHHNIVSEIYSNEFTEKDDDNENFQAVYRNDTYEYNSEQQLTRNITSYRKSEFGEGLIPWKIETRNYYYTLLDVIDGIKPIDGSIHDTFSLNGRTLSTNGEDLKVYAADGTLVARGKQIVLPTAGVYIVNCGNNHSKLVIK